MTTATKSKSKPNATAKPKQATSSKAGATLAERVKNAAVVQLDVRKLTPNPWNENKHTESDLAPLAESLLDEGQLQPVIVRAKTVGGSASGFQIIVGEGRWRACELAGLKTIDAKVVDVTDDEAQALTVVENAKRKNLNPIERARTLRRLRLPVGQGGAGKSNKEAGALLNLSESGASNLVRLLELPDWILDMISGEKMGEKFARDVLLKFPVAIYSTKLGREIVEDILKEGDALEQSARSLFWAIGSEFVALAPRTEYVQSVARVVSYDLKPDAATLEKLQVVEIFDPHNKKNVVRVCLNDELARKLLADAKAAAVAKFSKKCATASSSASEAKKPASEMTPKEKAAAEKQRRERFEKSLEGWTYQLKRFYLARTIAKSHSAAAGVLCAIIYADRGHLPTILKLAANATNLRSLSGDRMSGAPFFQLLELKSNKLSDVALERIATVVSLAFWSDNDEDEPLELNYSLIDATAAAFEFDFANAWELLSDSSGPKPCELYRNFFKLYNRDELPELARELGVVIPPGVHKSADIVDTLAGASEVKLPKVLAAMKKRGAK